MRTYGRSYEEMLADPRFVGDGSGPRVDPRDGAPFEDGAPIGDDIDPLGNPSPGGNGFASFYLDDNDRNGLPDINAAWGILFVNAGDPQWYDTINYMSLDGENRVAGLLEILSYDYGRGLACDGVFLDTIDNCAPNSYTGSDSPVRTEFEWTSPGYVNLISNIKVDHPYKIIVQNRGLFFFMPDLRWHYKRKTSEYIDLLLFESYRLGNNTDSEYDEILYQDNKYNIVPRIIAEAGRPAGFRILSLGYAEGPGISHDTLLGESMLGYETLLEDVIQTSEIGFRHYLTDRNVTLANSFVKDHEEYVNTSDTKPPVWKSTYNDTRPVGIWLGSEPTPRIGIQEVEVVDGAVVVRWDVAFDYHNVTYNLYYQDVEFDFIADPTLSNASVVTLVPEVGEGYGQGLHEQGSGPDIYPYEASVEGLVSGTTYYFLIRAVDSYGNEEENQIYLSATAP